MNKPILMSGGSGVVGTAVREQLGLHDYIALTHSRPLPGGVRTIRGDVCTDRLGVSRSEYDALTTDIGAVLHIAADTRLTSNRTFLDETNVVGTQRMMELASRARVPFHYVSTAFVDALDRPENRNRPMPYAESKRLAEQMVRTIDVPFTVLRLSIVVGSEETGAMSEFQGMHETCGAFLRGMFPAFPSEPNYLIDVVPRDLAARVIVGAVRNQLPAETNEVWTTSGPKAIRFGQLLDVLHELAEEIGKPMPPPRLVSSDMYERLIKPVFLPRVPADVRRQVATIFENVAPYVSAPQPLPQSVGVLNAFGGIGDTAELMRRTMRYWIRTTGYDRSDSLARNFA